MKVIEVDQVIDFSRYQLVDVRSPSEFAQGHIPGAVNVPLFFDEERHVIGCTYKDDGRPEAVLKGLEFVGPRMAELAKQGQQLAERGHLLLYCARGGMRSDSVGWLWERMGLGGQRLAGGYKTYRKWVLAQSSGSRTFLIIGGKTGSGKTELLHHLSGSGEQILDLEALAHHKGSVLGNLGQPPQPTQQQFENELASQLVRMDDRRPIWLENESKRIGKVQIPDGLWQQMLGASLIEIDMPLEDRITRLVSEYGCFSAEEVHRQLSYIAKRIGRERLKAIDDYMRGGQLREASRLMCEYYDRKYRNGTDNLRESKEEMTVSTESFASLKQVAAHLISLRSALVESRRTSLKPVESI